ncbi:MAG: ATP-binding cassette domain-containing protein [Bryobacterales bacterium]|jgi:ABC-2 type transport system ATP-binding protein|nr:ATP-binding cassette domain-containing protein [Bryobacterales bacterium]
MSAVIEVEDLVKDFRTFDRREGVWGAVRDLYSRNYRNFRAVDHVSFSVQAGEMVGYIGPNGAGKSTSIKMLTGILVPSSGRIRANGFTPFRERSRYARTIGVVFGQRTQLWWDIGVVESFRLLQHIYEIPQEDYDRRLKRFDEVLELKRYLHTPVRKLSLGERMRCDVAAALLHNPPLLFLDEPTIGLDIVAKENIRAFLKEVNREYGTTMLLTTHDLSDIEELCQRLMIIDHGKLLFDGGLAALKRQLWQESAIRMDLRDREQAALLGALDLPGVRLERVDDLSVRLHFQREAMSAASLIRRVVNEVHVLDIAIEEQSIENVVRRIYGGESLPQNTSPASQQ